MYEVLIGRRARVTRGPGPGDEGSIVAVSAGDGGAVYVWVEDDRTGAVHRAGLCDSTLRLDRKQDPLILAGLTVFEAAQEHADLTPEALMTAIYQLRDALAQRVRSS